MGWVRSLAEHPEGEVRIDGLVVRSDDAVALTPLPAPQLPVHRPGRPARSSVSAPVDGWRRP
jgi:hypothetical protein